VNNQIKFVLDETQIPKRYNLAADLPKPLPPVLHPGTKQPVGPADLEPLFPMALILQEVSTERTIDIPEPNVAAVTAHPRPPSRAGARNAGENLLQVRGCIAGRFAQAEHGGAAGLVQ
jgi:predicted alternative tryptophan synthase beta-subunit